MPYGYKQLLSVKDLLKVQARARALMGRGSDLIAIYYKDRMLYFKTRSGTDANIVWTQQIEITDATLENIMNARTFKDVEDTIKNSGLRVHCSCPAWLMWGMQYKATRLGYALIPEHRPPTRENRMPRNIPMVCFAAGTRVLTSDGYKAIESVNVGDWVFTHKGRLRQVMSVSSHLADETLDVRIGKITHVVCTPNHRFYAVKNTSKSNPSTRKVNIRSVDWIPADALRSGDFLMHPFLQLEHTMQVDNTLAFMAGLYAGDGSIQCEESATGRGSVCNEKFRVSGMQIALDNLYKEEYYRLFDSLGVEYSGDNLQEGTSSCSIRITDKRVRQFCLDVVNFTCLSKNQSKKLDSSVLHWNEEAQWAFIKGFFMADGTVVKGSGKKDNNHSYITLFNTNFDIMSKLHILLSQWYDVDLMYYDRAPFEENGRVVVPKRMYYIRLTGAVGADFADKVAYFMQFKRQGVDLDFTGYQESVYNYLGTNYAPKIIKGITSGVGCRVYNLEVAEDESYIVEGLAVHNCKHLYLVLQLYPFWSKVLASKFRNYYVNKVEQNQEIKNVERARMNKQNRSYVPLTSPNMGVPKQTSDSSQQVSSQPSEVQQIETPSEEIE